MLLVTGGAGFIGANFVLSTVGARQPVVNLDKLTYAGNLGSLRSLEGRADHVFVRGDIRDRALIRDLLRRHRPQAIINFAAESHVDRSILGPGEFVQTNVVGTFSLLEEARAYWSGLAPNERAHFRFLHVSTDEVYGSLELEESPFTESHPYAPNSPYAASKAAADHLARAYFHTYGLPVVTTNCSNNYGPYQFPEKLIPLVIGNALNGKPLPIYGDGRNVRDWLYVLDHCEAIRSVLANGVAGQSYNVGGGTEKANIDVVRLICALLDEMNPRKSGPYADLITFVKDRPGHDRRYAIDSTKLQTELGWRPNETFETGMKKTIAWYLSNEDWMREVTSGEYRKWIDKNYASRERA